MISDISKIEPVGADTIRPQDEDERDGRMISAPTRDKPRTPEMIGAEIRMYVDAGRRITLLCGIEIGRRLVEAKEMLNHGEWLPWLERETEFSTSSAARYMKVFEEYGAAQLGLFGPETNSPTLGNLSISNALRLLAIPENERESFAQEVDAEHLSARDLEALVKERTAEIEAELKSTTEDAKEIEYRRWQAEYRLEEQEKNLEKEKTARAEAEEALRRARDELREIESRPQTVAVERDEAAIAQALQAERERLEQERAAEISRAAADAADAEREKHLEAEKKAKKEIAELKEQIKKDQEEQAKIADALREAQAKADAAEKSGQDAERLQRDVETLKKQLTLADPAVKDFSAAFDRAQDELGHMNTALHEIGDEEIKGKLMKASIAMLEGFLERVKK